MVVMAAMMICLGASAIDKVIKKVEMTGEVTSLEALKSATFMLQNGDVVLYTPSGWDIKVAAAAIATEKTDNGGFFALTALDDHYLIPVFNIDKNRRTFWAGKQSVNAQPTGNVIFGLDGDNAQHGQDGANLAVWDVTYKEGEGFAFHCVGRDIYIGHDGSAARPVEAVTYWKAFTGFNAGYDVAAVEATAASVESALKVTDASATFASAKAAYEADKVADGALDKYVAAINAAIDVVNTCEQVNKTYANYKLSTLGAAAVKDVVAKYNAGEYKDVAALDAAYREAVKAQNSDGADMTGAIVNPSFELGNANGWTYEASDDHGAKENSNGTYTMSNNDGKYVFNIWSKGNAISQTIEGLPNGTYKLQAVIATDGGQKVQLNANDKNVQIDATDKGTGVEGEVEFEVTDGKATIGAEGVNKYWYKVDNFRLTLVKAANPAVPEKDDWYTGADFFRFRADKNATAESPYYAWKDKVEPVWGAAPLEEDNGCIVCKVPANVNPQSQIWIRGTEAGKTIAKGSKDGFKITFRVKADGEYTLESQAHNNWGYKTGKDPFGPLNVTTEWQTVSFVCTGEKAKEDFTDLCFNLSGDAERTIYFDDVQIVRGSEWYLNCGEIHAKDYQDPKATYADSDDPHPFARFVSDAEGGYVEVITNAARNNPWDSQIWIGIPAQYVGKSTKMTMYVWADKAVKCSESYHATATGKGWGASASPGQGIETTVGQWVEVSRILNTKDVNCNGVYKNMQVDYYCLDLSNDEKGSGTGITYRFKDIKFEAAQEAWYTNGKIIAKDYVKGDETYTNSDDKEFPLARYVYDDKGDYVEVQSNAKRVDEWDSQIWIEIPEAWVGKKVKLTMEVEASKEVTAAAAYHSFAGGNHWGPGAGEGVPFKVGEFTKIERILNTKDVVCNKNQQVKYYVLNLSNDEKGEGTGITYKFKNIAWSEAPVDTWADLIPLQDFEAGYTGADDEKLYFFEKEQEISSETYRARIVDGVGKDGGKAIEFRYAKNAEQGWYSQFEIRLPYLLPNGTKIKLTADIKADKAASGMGGQVWYNDFGSYRGGIPGYALEADTWYKYEKEITINDGEANDDPKGLRFLVFDGKGGSEANILYFDNISVQIAEDQVPAVDPDFLNAKDYPIFEYVDPNTLDWSENILKNGDLKSDDMREFILKNNDVENPEMLLAEKNEYGEIGIETAALPAEGGNDYDAQFFVRLPKVLPKGKKFNLEFDLYAEHINTLTIAAHGEPGEWKANISSVKTDPSLDAVHYQEYLTAPADMRTIAFNLAVADATTYGFSNIKVQVVNDDMAAIKAATDAADATSLWAETLALNEACYAGRTTETEGKNYTEESVKALEDAIAAGKAELKKNAAEVTAESLTAATKAIKDAINGLTKGDQLLPAPETDPDYANFVEIPLDQQDVENGDVHLAPKEDKGSYTQFTTTDGICVVFKMKDIDVTDCDYITIKFAKPAPAGQSYAVWTGNDNKGIDEGVSEIKYVFAEDPNCKIQNGILPEVSIISIFTGAGKDVSVYGVYKHKAAPALAYTDLTKEMFFVWSDWTDADATAQAGCAYEVGTSSDMPYGDGSVINYADLSEYATLEVTTTEGAPRFLFNRDVKDGQWNENEADSHLIDNTKGGWSAKYFTSKDNGDGSTTYIVDIAALVADKGYAHLHSIKGANWAKTTVTDMKLGYVGEKPALPIPVAINGIAEGASVKDGKYFINGQIVIVKNGVKYNAAGVAIK